MKPTELRIGNHVYLIDETDSIIETNVTARLLFSLDKEIIEISPIPLTEEWLERFGFKKHWWKIGGKTVDWGCNWRKGKFEIHWEKAYGFYHEFYRLKRNEIKYVHSLQNLYFALTGNRT